MKSTTAFFVVFSLLWFVNLNYARKEPGEYWKNIMKDQPLPASIKDLFVQDPASAATKNHFVKNFDTWRSAIIYHARDDDEKVKKLCDKELQSRHDDKLQEERSFVQEDKPANPTHTLDQKMKNDNELCN
ncbi:hypothetical protein Tsubulata_007062 [Turnera subulata]|uniref:Cathepsin propeptide inhibitor domain-containing protein n=1 Tax=Turnera subulata TaxID=218843 RepID=A0A9Q0GHY5_9ROSI|nr:hypothetical protein Tsubulata_007062 [Turnera subulata]